MKYLIVTIEGGGNIQAILHVVKKLKLKGHEVFILSEPWFKNLAEVHGATFIPFKEFFTKTNRTDDIMQDWKNKNNAFNVIFKSSEIVVQESIEVIKENNIHVLIADLLTPAALIAAEVMKIPGVLLFHTPEYLPGLNRPPGGLGLLPGNSMFSRVRNHLLKRVFNIIFDRYLKLMNSVRAKYNLKKLKHTSDLLHNADLRIIQTSKAFDFPIIPAPANVRYTGAVLDDPDWVEPWQNPWPLNDQRPLVIVSLSSTFQNQKQVIENCIEALGTLPVRALVTLGPAMENEIFQTPENVKIVKSASHAQIFPHASCIITHAGHGTVVRALTNGVPLICLPMGRDQNDNAAKVVYRGAGIKLSPKASPQKIGNAVLKILSDAAYKENAVKLGKVIKYDAEQDTLIKELESVF